MFNDTPDSSQQVTECLEGLNPIICLTALRGDLMTLFTRVTKLLNWQNDIMRRNMNAGVRVYISPFSQCQCWLFSLAECLCVLSIFLVQEDRVYSGLSCHLSSSSETCSRKNINCGQRIGWKKWASDKNVSLGSKKTSRETRWEIVWGTTRVKIAVIMFCLFWWCGHVELV